MKILHLRLFFAFFALFSCKNEIKKTTQETSDPAAAPTTVTTTMKPEIELFALSVNNLRLREQPNQQSKVITQIKSADFLEGTGEISSNKDTIELQNITWVEPYHKIMVLTPEQHRGWAFGGAIFRVYAGARATSPDLGALVQLKSFLSGLDTKKLENGKKAMDYIRTNLTNANGSLADAVFIIYERFMRALENNELYTMTESIKWTESDEKAVVEKKFDMNKYPNTKKLAENGFSLDYGEGVVVPVLDWQAFQHYFAPKVTPAMKTYIDQQTIDNTYYLMDDGGIVIPMNEVVDRAVAWETFNQANPTFVLREQTKEAERFLLATTMTGTNNTPAFDYESKMPTDEFKKMWDYAQQKYPNSLVAQKIKALTSLLATEGGKQTPKVESFLKQYQLEGM